MHCMRRYFPPTDLTVNCKFKTHPPIARPNHSIHSLPFLKTLSFTNNSLTPYLLPLTPYPLYPTPYPLLLTPYPLPPTPYPLPLIP